MDQDNSIEGQSKTVFTRWEKAGLPPLKRRKLDFKKSIGRSQSIGLDRLPAVMGLVFFGGTALQPTSNGLQPNNKH